MPEECTGSELEKVLDGLEDYNLTGRSYQDLQNALDSVENISAPIAEKLLKLCVPDRMEDLKYTAHSINIISSVLKKISNGQCSSLPNLIPSALALLHVLKTTVLYSSVETLKILCFDIIVAYPDGTLITLAVTHSAEVYELINLYCHQIIPTEIRLQPINVVGRLIKILPPDKREKFVKDGMKVWFSKVIPVVISYLPSAQNNDTVTKKLETLELLTDELVKFDYSNDPDWQVVLENIHTPKKYPAIMKSLLENGSDIWHRLWIVCIKLLKNQITKCIKTSASPINSLLPCVEMAFKLDIRNRCRAFLCWNVVIDNFSKETNEAFLNKRLKLLVVPLTSNNAKVEETALAKFNTWWHLITVFCFQMKLEKYLEMIVIPFLHFCFGKPSANVLIPGKLSVKTKVQCVQAFINIIGHVDCEGCVTLPKLNMKLVNSTLLVKYPKEWIHAMGNTIRLCVEHNSVFSEKQIKCVWKSFITLLGDLPENDVKRNLFNETLDLLETFTQGPDNRLSNAVVNILIPTLLDGDDKIQSLWKTKFDQQVSVKKIINILNDAPLDNRLDEKYTIENIKILTNYIVEEAIETSDDMIKYVENSLSSKGMLLWTAMAESISCYIHKECPDTLASMFLWPFKYMNNFVNKEESTTAWLKMYKIISPHLQMNPINKDIVNVLLLHGDNQSSCMFILSAAIAVLEQKLNHEDCDVIQEVELIIQMTSKIKDSQILLILPSLSGVIVSTLKILKKTENIVLAEYTMFIINNILKIFQQNAMSENDHLKYIKNIFDLLESTLKLESYKKLKSLLVEQLKLCAPYLKHEKQLKSHILAIYNRQLNKHQCEIIYDDILQAYELVDDTNIENQSVIDKKANIEKVTNASPKLAKKSKQASIVNTVVDNGEEFVVVKSNWKFNPKRLTDHQKEKLQRKREDIPALYQDLSQSQDEFKLTKWKTDSQDTSTTSSKSAYALGDQDDVSVILKNMPSSEFLPNIIENVICKPVVGEGKLNNDNSENNDKTKKPVKNDKLQQRMALKDRVFQNVQILIEKSKLGQESKDVTFNNTEDVLRTPVHAKVKPPVNQVSSAPSQLNSERPSRVKRKPRKFDDLQLFTLKKRRHSDNNLETEMITTNVVTEIDSVEDNKIEDKKKDKFEEIQNKRIVPGICDSIIDLEKGDNDSMCENIVDVTKHCDMVNKQDEKIKKLILNDKLEEKSILDENKIVDVIPSTQNENKNVENSSNLYKAEYCSVNTIMKEEMSTNTVNVGKVVSKEKIKENSISDSKKNSSQNIEKNKKPHRHESESHVVSTVLVNKTKRNIEEKLCSGGIKNNTHSCLNDEIQNDMCPNDTKIAVESTPKVNKAIQKSSNKKSGGKNSKNEIKNLAIDMVKSLTTVQSEKRSTRRSMLNNSCKSPSPSATPKKNRVIAVENKTNKIKDLVKHSSVKDSQNTQDISASQDFIESSQDSTVSIKSNKANEQKFPLVVVEPLPKCTTKTQTTNLLDNSLHIDLTTVDSDSSDIELSSNKTNSTDLTENMDTECIKDNSNTFHALSEGNVSPIPVVLLSTEETKVAEEDTQNTPDADTQPLDPEIFSVNTEKSLNACQNAQITDTDDSNRDQDDSAEITIYNESDSSLMATANDITKTMSESILVEAEKETRNQRKKDFLNNTLEISPIKTLSPVPDQKSPLPETSSDYVIIKLTSPVHSNGVPFDKHESPEIFTEDKVSPDKRDKSPPRSEICITNTSPSSSLSLKKNRPQVRSGGRAAHMLGLCVPDRLQSTMDSEKLDEEEVKKSPSLNTPARRNLYNCTPGENNENSAESEDSENFLKFKKKIPTTDCSPSGPILKRKIIDITDETTASPASKRKRVSFHDPPVSTTICVRKYIEPISVRSPQNSATKRQERQSRAQTATKSPRRLENVFKLNSVLTNTVESFSAANDVHNTNEDTETSSLDETPVVEVVKTSDLNDIDPICLELIDCKDPIANIAAELSSPAMKTLLVKTIEDTVECIGDLAKMTELEVNRLCIKAPKVQTAKKVLNDYLSKLNKVSEIITPSIEVAMSESIVPEAKTSVEVQTDAKSVENIEMQTESVEISLSSSQTDSVLMSTSCAQTDESGSKSIAEIIKSCLSEKPDFFKDVLIEALHQRSKSEPNANNEDIRHNVLSILQNHLPEWFEFNDIMQFCTKLIQNKYAYDMQT